jgi:hypothetical protein
MVHAHRHAKSSSCEVVAKIDGSKEKTEMARRFFIKLSNAEFHTDSRRDSRPFSTWAKYGRAATRNIRSEEF